MKSNTAKKTSHTRRAVKSRRPQPVVTTHPGRRVTIGDVMMDDAWWAKKIAEVRRTGGPVQAFPELGPPHFDDDPDVG